MMRSAKRSAALLAVLLVSWSCDFFTAQEPGGFYTPPDPLPDGPPGTLLRSESIEAGSAGTRAWRILYTSTDPAGAPVAVSGFVISPGEPDSASRPATDSLPVLAWAHGSVGIHPRCGVSHTDDPYQQTPAVDDMVARGFVVVATDYPGLGTPGIHPYLVGGSEARAVLDAVRATRILVPVAGSRFAVWGASQGGHAALWTAETAADYAPELTLVAAAASAPATDLARIVEAQMDSKVGGLFLSHLLRAWDDHYEEARIDEVLRPERRDRVDRMAEFCFTALGGLLRIGGLVAPREYLAADLRETSPWRELFAENTPDGPIDVPLFVAQGLDDDVVAPEITRREVGRRCGAGETVSFLPLPGVGHDARDESASAVLAWLEDRFEGRPVTDACSW